MEAAESKLRDLLAEHGVLVRNNEHAVYRLSNGHCVSIRRPGKKGNNDHWKSALSYVKRTLRLPPATKSSDGTSKEAG